MGICSVSKQSCSNILRRGAGQAITIVVGGAAESLAARPGTADLTLRRRCVLDLIYFVHRFSLLYVYVCFRLGFIKIAIQHGYVDVLGAMDAWIAHQTVVCRADLVPVFSFGENDVSRALCLYQTIHFTLLSFLFLPDDRYINKWQMTQAPRFINSRRSFRTSSVSRCHSSMAEGF